MDPILAQKTEELYGKLSRARQTGATVTEAQIENWMRRETKGKYGLADAQQYAASLGEHSDAKNISLALGQGASFNTVDEVAGAVGGDNARNATRLRDKAYSSRHPYKSLGLKLGGAVLTPAVIAALAPEAVTGGAATGGAMLTRAALTGATMAGLSAAGSSEAPDLSGRLKEAAIPAAAGLALGVGGALGSKVVGGALSKSLRFLRESPDAAAVRLSGRLMPEGLEQQAARQEMLAPDTFIPAGASPQATEAAVGVGASPRAALHTEKTVQEALTKIQAAKDGLGPEYDALAKQAGPMKVDNTLRDLLHSVNEDQPGPSVGLDKLQRLRTYYAERAGRTTNSEDRSTFGAFVEGMTNWLEPRVKGLSELDSRYAFLSDTKENYEMLLQKVQNSNAAHGKVGLYGGEAGSIGGNLPAGPRGWASAMANKLTPGKDLRSEAIARAVMQPADASQVASLASAREFAMAPRAPTPGSNFVAPAASGNAILTLWDMLTKGMPTQMENPQAGQ